MRQHNQSSFCWKQKHQERQDVGRQAGRAFVPLRVCLVADPVIRPYHQCEHWAYFCPICLTGCRYLAVLLLAKYPPNQAVYLVVLFLRPCLRCRA